MRLTYLLLNKPFQVLSQFTPANTGSTARRTLAEFIAAPNVYPVGRLDYDSEGLLLLTDDGKLQHRLSNPRFAHPRTYWVQVEGEITREAVHRLTAGVEIRDYRTQPCEARIIPEPDLWPRNPPIRYRKSIPVSWLELTLREGRNRQVRHMTAAVSFPTLRLVRVGLGPLTIQGLSAGASRPLTDPEIAALTRSAPPPPLRRRRT